MADTQAVAYTLAQLLVDGRKAAGIINEDMNVFEVLSLEDKRKVWRAIKKIKPFPEDRRDHGWLCDWMKEMIDSEEADDEATESDVEKLLEATTEVTDAAELAAAANATVEATVTKAPEPVEEVTITHVVSADVARKVAEQSCILEFYQSEPTFRKKVSAASILSHSEVEGIANIDPTRLSVSKALIETAELRELLMHRRRFNRELKTMSLPGGLLTLAGGQYLVPLAYINKIKANIDTYVSVRGELLDRFEERYPSIIEHARAKLGDLFDESDYPPFHLLREAYTVQYKFVSNAVPEELKRVSDAIYKSESKRVLAECAGAAVEIEAALRQRMADLVEHFADKLGVDEATGRPKQLHGSVVASIKDFLATFQDMNLTGDAKLKDLVEQAKGLLGGADADQIRANPELRTRLKEGFAGIQEATAALVETRKRRVVLE